MKINSFLLATGLMTLLAGKLLLAQSDYATPYAITTLAGTTGQTGSANGTGSAALFYHPNGVAVDGSGNLYVADNSTIRKITPGGAVSTLAGMVLRAWPWTEAVTSMSVKSVN